MQKQFYRDYSTVSLGAPLKNSDAPLLGDLCNRYRAILEHNSADIIGLEEDRKKSASGNCRFLHNCCAHRQAAGEGRNMAAKEEFQRLPTNVVPRHYELFLQPDLKAFSFTGKTIVQINVSTNNDSSPLLFPLPFRCVCFRAPRNFRFHRICKYACVCVCAWLFVLNLCRVQILEQTLLMESKRMDLHLHTHAHTGLLKKWKCTNLHTLSHCGGPSVCVCVPFSLYAAICMHCSVANKEMFRSLCCGHLT